MTRGDRKRWIAEAKEWPATMPRELRVWVLALATGALWVPTIAVSFIASVNDGRHVYLPVAVHLVVALVVPASAMIACWVRSDRVPVEPRGAQRWGRLGALAGAVAPALIVAGLPGVWAWGLDEPRAVDYVEHARFVATVACSALVVAYVGVRNDGQERAFLWVGSACTVVLALAMGFAGAPLLLGTALPTVMGFAIAWVVTRRVSVGPLLLGVAAGHVGAVILATIGGAS